MVALFVVGLCVVVAAAMAIASRTNPLSADDHEAGLLGTTRRLVRPLGRWVGPIAVVAVGWVVILAVMLPLEKVARGLEKPVDEPVFTWTSHRIAPSSLVRTGVRELPLHLVQRGWWHRANQFGTDIGNTKQIRVFIIVASIALAWVWRKRAFWLPPVALGGIYIAEYYGQKILVRLTHRGHPPTTLGTFPSGGCARTVCVYGMTVVLILLSRRVWPRSVMIGAWTALAVAGFVEAFTRITLLKHWFTDVPSGLLYGALLLLVFTTATRMVVSDLDEEHSPADRAGTVPS